jgi:hypothetical protein
MLGLGRAELGARVVTRKPSGKGTIIVPTSPTGPRDKINLWLSDPTVPLTKQISIPSNSVLRYAVAGYSGGGFALGTVQGQAANVYAHITHALNSLQSGITKWAATPNLAVYPRAGRDWNAYYDRRSLRFFYETDKTTNHVIYSADSSEIVVHELGHAMLDSMRPDLWSASSIEIWAFHEGFADICAMLNLMQYDEVINESLIGKRDREIER